MKSMKSYGGFTRGRGMAECTLSMDIRRDVSALYLS